MLLSLAVYISFILRLRSSSLFLICCFCHYSRRISFFFKFFFKKIWCCLFFVLPLHSLLRTPFLFSMKKAFFERIYINREVVQEARCVFIYAFRVEETNRSIIWRAFALDSILNKEIRSEQITLEVWLWSWGIRAFSSLAITLSTLFYNGEFDPGSGWTLATGLTHASRGETTLKLASMVVDRRTGE